MRPDPYVAGENAIKNPMDTQSWNRYAYAGADPTNRNDPSGYDWCDDEDLFCLVGYPGYPNVLSGYLAALAASIAATNRSPIIQSETDNVGYSADSPRPLHKDVLFQLAAKIL